MLLFPFQVGVLGTPSPAVTPTNLLYNVVATPGALRRHWRQGQTGGSLAAILIAGTLPGWRRRQRFRAIAGREAATLADGGAGAADSGCVSTTTCGQSGQPGSS